MGWMVGPKWATKSGGDFWKRFFPHAHPPVLEDKMHFTKLVFVFHPLLYCAAPFFLSFSPESVNSSRPHNREQALMQRCDGILVTDTASQGSRQGGRGPAQNSRDLHCGTRQGSAQRSVEGPALHCGGHCGGAPALEWSSMVSFLASAVHFLTQSSDTFLKRKSKCTCLRSHCMGTECCRRGISGGSRLCSLASCT